MPRRPPGLWYGSCITNRPVTTSSRIHVLSVHHVRGYTALMSAAQPAV